jgi:hypothetical protein
LPVNERRPAQNASPDSWPILIPQQSLIGTTGSDELDDSRVYWARYENTIGKTWETHNPWDRSAPAHSPRSCFAPARMA